ncbi:MAG: iron-containing alcohol dehydrogenase [Pseudomonadota bacterium]
MQTSTLQLTCTERVHMGQPAAQALLEEAERLQARRIFLLVSHSLRTQTDEIARIEQALGDRVAAVHDGIPPHAPRSAVLAAAARAREVNCDLVVTVGGGSVTDAGKIIPLALKYDLREHDDMEPYHVYVNDAGETVKPEFDGPDIRVICCPTTLSGGEFNPLSGATDEVVGHKQGFEHPAMAPVSIVLDPALTRHTPSWLWTSTGVRSLDHALETLGSLQSDHFSDGIAESALRLLSQALPAVKANPDDMDARLRCQIGAWQSMLPILGGVPMGASHAIGHILGGTADVPHGYCSCVMAPAVLQFNEPANGHRQTRISACFGDSAAPASELVDRFISSLEMPRSLAAVDVSEDQFDHIAEFTMLDFWARTNPRTVEEAADIRQILELAR